MSDSDDSPGRREVAHRLFATEYDNASLEYSESDEERAPNYVVTPTGARVNRLFVVGVLTAVEPVNDETVRARVVDPTGAYIIYAGQYQPDELAFFERTEPPAFVAVTGKANAFQPEDSDRVLTSIRPESVNEVDEDTRDRWVVTTARQTFDRIGTMATALASDDHGESLRAALTEDGVAPERARAIDLAVDHYDTTPDYLGGLQSVATDATAVVAGEQEEVEPLELRPAETTGEFDAAVLAERLTGSAGVTAPDGASSEESSAHESTGTDTAETATATTSEPSEATEPTETDDDPENDSTAPAAAEDASETAVQATTDTSSSPETAAATAETEAASEDEPAGEASISDEFEGSEDIGSTESTSSLGNFDDGGDDEPEEPPQTDEMYEFDEEEREQVKEEHGLEFSTGTEVESSSDSSGDEESATEQDAGDAAGSDPADEPDDHDSDGTVAKDIDDATDVDDPADDDPADDDDADTATAADDDEATTETSSSEDASIDDVLLDTMDDLDDGDGADREAVIDAVIDATGATADEVEEAIEDALMSGQCYEPDDDSLKPI